MWIARDKDGSLWLFSTKPEKHEKPGAWMCSDNSTSVAAISTINFDNPAFPEVTWENSPKELIIKD